MQQVKPHEWRRHGLGGPPEPWEPDAQRNFDRLSTSYYVDILESRRVLIACGTDDDRRRVEELFTTATRHKQEIDYTLRHWATPAERLRVEDRLGSLMRIGIRLRQLRETSAPDHPLAPAPEPAPAA